MNVTSSSALAMQTRMIGSPATTSLPIAFTDKVSPRMTMPSRRIVLMHNRSPGSYAVGTPTELRTISPSITASVMGLIGLLPAA